MMIRCRWLLMVFAFLYMGWNAQGASVEVVGARPNIVFILADDMGYGDIRACNPESKIPTPHLDRLAADGMRMTDMHAGASWCAPSRYALLTGRCPWRYSEGFGNRNGYAGHMIGSDDTTLASLLKARGYRTGCIGKWHLGLGPKDTGPTYEKGVRVPNGPNDIGFDYSYILPASLDIPPYLFLENQVPTASPSEHIPGRDWPATRWAMGEFWREGDAAPGFDFRGVLPHLRDQAVRFIGRQKQETPFFLYLPLTAPHTPWMPTEEFQGRSNAGMYGDFVAQVDSVVGDVLKALEDGGFGQDTLVMFSSDNGAFWVDAEKEEFDHLANGPLRGGKMDVWEGGHRVPFIARWPGKVPAGKENPALLCFTDMLATMAALVAPEDWDAAAFPDSVNALPALLGEEYEPYALREQLILQAGPGYWVRKGDWKLANFLGSGGFTPPKRIQPEPGGPEGQLYNLATDLAEQENLYLEKPEIQKRLTRLIEGRGLVQPIPGSTVYVPTRVITKGPAHHWFGYYDKLEFDPTGRFVLGMAVDFEGRSPRPDDVIRVGMVDLENDDQWLELGTSRAWGWQQGCMLQFIPGSDSEVIWNDRDGDRYVSHIKNIRTGEVRTLPFPVYTLSPDGRTAMSADFERINHLRPGYGYAGIPDPNADVAAPEDAGIYRCDLETGEKELIISIADMAGRKVPPAAEPFLEDIRTQMNWFNHLLFNTDGSRFVFLHRWKAASKRDVGGFGTLMYSSDPAGNDIRIVDGSGYTSHFIWRDPKSLTMWTRHDGRNGFFVFQDDGSDHGEIVGEGVMTRNGHNTYLPGNEWILNDTYPDGQRMQHVYLYHVPTGRRVPLGDFYLAPEYRGEWRCDTHPRSSPDGRRVVIDCPVGDLGRQLVLMELGG